MAASASSTGGLNSSAGGLNSTVGALKTSAVPPLDPQAMKLASKGVVENDEVAEILKGLRLDRQFFQQHMRPEPTSPEAKLTSGDGNRLDVASAEDKVKANRKSVRSSRRNMVVEDVKSKRMHPDFDIYLNEALMPVLAQSLDSLCRHIARMEEQGDRLDPKVRARFNPLTWLAQQLLRRHPKCAKTPRRQALYKNFNDWADVERGRREMLRRRKVVHDVFAGFVLHGLVQRSDIFNVLNAVDDTMHLGGRLKENAAMQAAFGAGDSEPYNGPRKRASFFTEKGWTFEQFWCQFSSVIASQEVVPYSAISEGNQLRQQELQDREHRVEMEQKEAEERHKKEETEQQQLAVYTELYGRLQADPALQAILTKKKILTGDYVRVKDAGYEYEVAPKGPHVALLCELMKLLGIPNINDEEVPPAEKWWTADLAQAWTVLQEANQSELSDGVVEREVLEKVIVPPSAFILLSHKVEDELERQAEEKGEPTVTRAHGDSDRNSLDSVVQKPSKEALCKRLGMTMARMEWLHQLFESYLQPPEDDGTALPPIDMYPEHPAHLTKEQMRALMIEVHPKLASAEFEARFKRIDEDKNGRVEFNEFVIWVHEDEVRIVGNLNRKMTFQELAHSVDEPVGIIQYLHTCFQDQLPDGVVDRYPEKCATLSKDEACDLVSILTPTVPLAEIIKLYNEVDTDQKGRLEFDEWLELVDIEELPAEVREMHGKE